MNKSEIKLNERELKQEMIVQTAKEIIQEVGVEKLSIRKIAERMEYSPGIIYHYFQDKNAIMEQILLEGYQKIIQAVDYSDLGMLKPKEQLLRVLKRYMDSCLKNGNEYKLFMLNESEPILNYTRVLYEGVSKEHKTFQMITSLLKEHDGQSHVDSYYELQAQVIFSATFGIIIKQLIEQHIREDLISQFIEFVSISLGGEAHASF